MIAIRLERRRQTRDIIGGPCWQHQSIAYGAFWSQAAELRSHRNAR